MGSPKIADNFKKYVDFNKEEIDMFFQLAKRRVIEKNKYATIENDEACFFHIESGCLMTYVKDQADQKHVLQFGVDLWWTGDLETIIKGTKSTQYIRAVDRTVVYVLDKSSYEKLLACSQKYERFFRILFQNSLISHQKRIIRNISFSAEERYLSFVEQFPQMEMLVAQKYIASYLGITPEFFSKLKKLLAEKEQH